MIAIIQKAIQKEVERIIAEEAVEAAVRTEKRVRAKTAEIAATVMRRLVFEPYGDSQLRIVLDFKNTET